MDPESTTVAIVGGGPAGLMLSHLLARDGVDSIVIDHRTREEIEHTHRAGILEAQSVALLRDTGVESRVLTHGYEHGGIYLRFNGTSHHIDFKRLVDASVWLYPQTDVFVDLADARERDGGDVRFGVSDAAVHDLTGTPRVTFSDADGTAREITARWLVGADGSRSICRKAVPEHERRHYFREYPFAWFGILAQTPMNADELVYTRSERGFALISQRTESLQRLYFQCSPDEDIAQWSDDRIWSELQSRVAGEDGFSLHEGPIVDKSVLPFRSFVAEPLRYGNLLLAGDAGHTVPPTGAKGLNLALQDVRVLAESLTSAVQSGPEALDGYSQRALQRVWKAQAFSYRMTTLLHATADENPFDGRRQLGELDSIVGSERSATEIAECYTGWPNSSSASG